MFTGLGLDSKIRERCVGLGSYYVGVGPIYRVVKCKLHNLSSDEGPKIAIVINDFLWRGGKSVGIKTYALFQPSVFSWPGFKTTEITPPSFTFFPISEAMSQFPALEFAYDIVASVFGSSNILKSMPPGGACVSTIPEPVHITLTEFGCATLAVFKSRGVRSCANKKGPTQFTRMLCGKSFSTKSFGGILTPALLKSTSSLVSAARNAVAAGLMVVRSPRSRERYLRAPGVEGLLSFILTIAASDFAFERLAM